MSRTHCTWYQELNVVVDSRCECEMCVCGGGTKLCTEGKENESVDIHHTSLVGLHFRDSVISGALCNFTVKGSIGRMECSATTRQE